MLFTVRDHAQLIGRLRQPAPGAAVRLGDPVYALVQRTPFEVENAAREPVFGPGNLVCVPVSHLYADGAHVEPTGQWDVYRSFPAGTAAEEVVAHVTGHNARVVADLRASLAAEAARETGPDAGRLLGWRLADLRQLEERAGRATPEALRARLAEIALGPQPVPAHRIGESVSVRVRFEGRELGRFDAEIVGVGLNHEIVVYHFDGLDSVPEADVAAPGAGGDRAAVLRELRRLEAEQEVAQMRSLLDGLD